MQRILYGEPSLPERASEPARELMQLALCKTAADRPSAAQLLEHAWVR